MAAPHPRRPPSCASGLATCGCPPRTSRCSRNAQRACSAQEHTCQRQAPVRRSAVQRARSRAAYRVRRSGPRLLAGAHGVAAARIA
jgi:hypothetical protein